MRVGQLVPLGHYGFQVWFKKISALDSHLCLANVDQVRPWDSYSRHLGWVGCPQTEVYLPPFFRLSRSVFPARARITNVWSDL